MSEQLPSISAAIRKTKISTANKNSESKIHMEAPNVSIGNTVKPTNCRNTVTSSRLATAKKHSKTNIHTETSGSIGRTVKHISGRKTDTSSRPSTAKPTNGCKTDTSRPIRPPTSKKSSKTNIRTEASGSIGRTVKHISGRKTDNSSRPSTAKPTNGCKTDTSRPIRPPTTKKNSKTNIHTEASGSISRTAKLTNGRKTDTSSRPPTANKNPKTNIDKVANVSFSHTAMPTNYGKADRPKTAQTDNKNSKTNVDKEANVHISHRTQSPIRHKNADVKVSVNESGISICTCKSDVINPDLKIPLPKSSGVSLKKSYGSLSHLLIKCPDGFQIPWNIEKDGNMLKDAIHRRFVPALLKGAIERRKKEEAEKLAKESERDASPTSRPGTPFPKEMRYWEPTPMEMFLMADKIPLIFVRTVKSGRKIVKVPLNCHNWVKKSRRKLDTIFYDDDEIKSRSNSPFPEKKCKSSPSSKTRESSPAKTGKSEEDEAKGCSAADTMGSTVCPKCKRRKVQVSVGPKEITPSSSKYQPLEEKKICYNNTEPGVCDVKEGNGSSSSRLVIENDSISDSVTSLSSSDDELENIISEDGTISIQCQFCEEYLPMDSLIKHELECQDRPEASSQSLWTGKDNSTEALHSSSSSAVSKEIGSNAALCSRISINESRGKDNSTKALHSSSSSVVSKDADEVKSYDSILQQSLAEMLSKISVSPPPVSTSFSSHPNGNTKPKEETCWYCGWDYDCYEILGHCERCAEYYNRHHKMTKKEARKRTLLRRVIETRLKTLLSREKGLETLPSTSARLIAHNIRINKANK